MIKYDGKNQMKIFVINKPICSSFFGGDHYYIFKKADLEHLSYVKAHLAMF